MLLYNSCKNVSYSAGVRYKGESVLNWGDINILSFHATKIFHTIEGGALIINDDALCEQARKMINFGITGQESIECLGINAKMNEFQAAMGLCLLDEMDAVIARRSEIAALYDSLLSEHVVRQRWTDDATCNYHYYPVLFESETITKYVQEALNAKDIYPRRYFYPSLDSLTFLAKNQRLPISRDIASRILCLPFFAELSNDECAVIAQIILNVLDVE